MFFVYILKSFRDGNLYIGSTSDLERRLQEHNAGVVISTKARRPFKIVYVEGYSAEREARHREQNLKLRAKAFRQLMNRIQDSVKS